MDLLIRLKEWVRYAVENFSSGKSFKYHYEYSHALPFYRQFRAAKKNP